ncbi:uncharacterized protein LOC128725999 [Anopheles nili]|uniref:uncharacterized protein LOC128725999 n=1 Tax=Anopheles nili TaxID=185578 RepID=UPI00237A73C0|nr:uncharacterized protein LOC128725999 [Anopheles nili]
MIPKPFWVIAAFGLISMNVQVDATQWHAKQVLQFFRRVRLDKTKNPVYQSDVLRGIRTHLREPLVQKALCLPKGTKLSADCLNRMVDKARQNENRFYAKFTYACKRFAEYSASCLETARPLYYRSLAVLANQTEKCWKA